MRTIAAVVGLLLFTPFANAQSKASKMLTQYGWLTSLDSARAEAKRTSKPLMIVFRCDP